MGRAGLFREEGEKTQAKGGGVYCVEETSGAISGVNEIGAEPALDTT